VWVKVSSPDRRSGLVLVLPGRSPVCVEPEVEVPLALTRFVELEPGDRDRAVQEMRDAGVTVT